MTAHSTDPPEDRPERFRPELEESRREWTPSAPAPGHPGQFALEAALHLSGGRGGWVETEAGDERQIWARQGLTEEEVQVIRSRINATLNQTSAPGTSAPASPSVHLPLPLLTTKALLFLPLMVQSERGQRRIGAIVVLLPEADPLPEQRRQTLEHLAVTVALQFDQIQKTTAELSALLRRLHSYETLTQRSLAGIFRATESGEILQCNAACARIMGYASPEDMEQVNSRNFYLHPEERESLWRNLRERGGSALIEAIRIRKDGQPVRLLQDLQLFPDEPGGAPVLHGTLFELASDVPATPTVKEGLNLYRKMIENQCDTIILVDRDARVLFCGPSIERTFGYRPEELLHHSGFDYVHPEDQVLVRAQLRKMIAGTAVVTAELRLLHRNGLWRWVEMTASNQLDDPDLQGILLSYRDITERRQQEEEVYRNERRHQLIFEASGDVIWDWDMKTNSVRVSGAFQTLFGYPLHQIETNAGWWFMRIHPDDVDRMSRFFTQALTSSQEFWSDEFRLRQADGSWGVAFARGYILRGRDHAPLRMTGAMTDMTAHHRLHRFLEEDYGNIAIGFLAINTEGMLVYANPAARQLLGTGDRILSGTSVLHDDHLRHFSFISRVETSLREHIPQHLLEVSPQTQTPLQIDIFPSQDGITVYLQHATSASAGAPQRKGYHPLQILSHLPGFMGTLAKPFTHRRP